MPEFPRQFISEFPYLKIVRRDERYLVQWIFLQEVFEFPYAETDFVRIAEPRPAGYIIKELMPDMTGSV